MFDLSFFGVDEESDLKTNLSQEEKNNGDVLMSMDTDPLEELRRPKTRSRARKTKEVLQQVLCILFEYKSKFEGEKTKVVNASWPK